DFNSWILLIIGILFSIIAFIDGMYLSDPYPGYSGVESRARAAEEEYRNRKEELIGGLKDIRDEHNEKVTEIINDLSKRRLEHKAIIGHRARLTDLFSTYQNQLESAANSLLRLYRSTNVRARKDEPPAYFARDYELVRIIPSPTLPGEWDDAEL